MTTIIPSVPPPTRVLAAGVVSTSATSPACTAIGIALVEASGVDGTVFLKLASPANQASLVALATAVGGGAAIAATATWVDEHTIEIQTLDAAGNPVLGQAYFELRFAPASAVQPPSPLAIFGFQLALWCRGDHVIVSGGKVTQWTDLVGGLPLVQAAPGKRPAFSNGAGPNSTPAVEWDHTAPETLLGRAGSSGFSGDPDISCAWVGNSQLASGEEATIALVGDPNADGLGFYVLNQAGPGGDTGLIESNSGSGSILFPSGGVHYLNSQHAFLACRPTGSYGTSTFYVDGVSQTLGASSEAALNIPNVETDSGSFNGQPGFGNNGPMEELMLIIGIPTAAQRAQLFTYFQARYGL